MAKVCVFGSGILWWKVEGKGGRAYARAVLLSQGSALIKEGTKGSGGRRKLATVRDLDAPAELPVAVCCDRVSDVPKAALKEPANGLPLYVRLRF